MAELYKELTTDMTVQRLVPDARAIAWVRHVPTPVYFESSAAKASIYLYLAHAQCQSPKARHALDRQGGPFGRTPYTRALLPVLPTGVLQEAFATHSFTLNLSGAHATLGRIIT